MSSKPVTVHACRHAEMDDGSDFSCTCKKHVTVRVANELVAAGLAYFKRAPLGAVDNRQVLFTGRQVRLPNAVTITKSHIFRAYVFDGEDVREVSISVHEQRRIELYGYLTQLCFVELGANERERSSVSPGFSVTPRQAGEGPAVYSS